MVCLKLRSCHHHPALKSWQRSGILDREFLSLGHWKLPWFTSGWISRLNSSKHMAASYISGPWLPLTSGRTCFSWFQHCLHYLHQGRPYDHQSLFLFHHMIEDISESSNLQIFLEISFVPSLKHPFITIQWITHSYFQECMNTKLDLWKVQDMEVEVFPQEER